MNSYGVIMAGGGGTRFWPLSRQKKPKQLLNLTGRDFMVNEAVDRLIKITGEGNVFIVTNSTQIPAMLEVTAGRVQPDHILSEPAARNTSACIGYAAMEIVKKYGDGVMIITPADAYIKDTVAFTRVLSDAVKVAEERDRLVTIGITPTFPATGYGYIKFDKTKKTVAKTVAEFKEKPDAEAAASYISSGTYAWNSGMFIWKASVILDKFQELIPDIYAELSKIGDVMGQIDEHKVVEETYPNIRKISVDYAIMEPAAANGDVLMVPGEFGWSDIGSLDMMGVLHDVDESGNIALGDTITINTTNSVIYSSKRLVAVLGVNNLIVVETPDAIMVCNKEQAQDVKLIVEELNSAKRKDLL